ncbi:SufD family Fe-S cluster assembly protein [Limosilactobacillus avium]|uniref:SufD family Fe-S cluster assembly protein n=1 Tax=Limosilactobacillus avium TaxID=2991831 RepID=UPI0024BAAE21|nr:SufD family Fe-S cluster assembly protein [Limosilactobacillus avium]
MTKSVVNWAGEPAWLTKKRQLAQVLQDRLPKLKGQEQWLPWQAETGGYQENWLVHQGRDLVAIPLAQAVGDYSALLQENLMEKGISWQDNQLFAAHLANLDGGQFIYVPSDHDIDLPITFAPRGMMTNPQNVIIVGANSKVTLVEKMMVKSAQPLFADTAILVGANAKVCFTQVNQLRAPVIFQGLSLYQARGAQVKTKLTMENEGDVTIRLSNFLDGDGSQWTTTAVLNPRRYGKYHFSPQVDGFGKNSQAVLTTYLDERQGGSITREPFKPTSGEPLKTSERVINTK